MKAIGRVAGVAVLLLAARAAAALPQNPNPPFRAGAARLHPPLDGRELARRRQRRAGPRAARQQLLRERHELRLGTHRPATPARARSATTPTSGTGGSWFRGPASATYLVRALRRASAQRSGYSRLGPNPGGENRIVIFKSCFPNSDARRAARPTPSPRSAATRSAARTRDSAAMTVANAKGIYNDLLAYFAGAPGEALRRRHGAAARRTATRARRRPATRGRSTTGSSTTGWPATRTTTCSCFDFYDVLTSNGGSTRTNDPASTTSAGPTATTTATATASVEHVQTRRLQLLRPTAASASDSHPSRAGNLKATGELVEPPQRRLPLLGGRRRLSRPSRSRRGSALRHRGHAAERRDRPRRRDRGHRLGPRRPGRVGGRDLAQRGRGRGDGPGVRGERDVRERGKTGRGGGVPGLPERHARGLGLHAADEHAARRRQR